MRLCFTTEERFLTTPDGCYWSPANTPAYSFFRRYLGVFDEIRVIARVASQTQPPPAWRRADGPGVTFGPVPSYTGPVQYLRHWRSVDSAVRRALGPDDAIILRVPSQVAVSAEPALRDGRPFGLEVVGDPYNVFAPGANHHPLRALWRWWFTKRMQRQCARAAAVCYVTGRYLQQQYPAAKTAFCTSFQPMELGGDAFVPQSRTACALPGPVRIVTVGSLEQPYKGVDVLIDAIAMAVAQGQDLYLTVVGSGRYQPALKRQAEQHGLDGRVKFINEVRNDQLLQDLDGYHVFVLASRTEGLPRVIIEAMARAMPCVASAVGGIPELLSPEDLVPPGDARALCRKIIEVTTDSSRMERMSARNLSRSHEYSGAAMDALRRDFLLYLCRTTQKWAGEHQRAAVCDVTAG